LFVAVAAIVEVEFGFEEGAELGGFGVG